MTLSQVRKHRESIFKLDSDQLNFEFINDFINKKINIFLDLKAEDQVVYKNDSDILIFINDKDMFTSLTLDIIEKDLITLQIFCGYNFSWERDEFFISNTTVKDGIIIGDVTGTNDELKLGLQEDIIKAYIEFCNAIKYLEFNTYFYYKDKHSEINK